MPLQETFKHSEARLAQSLVKVTAPFPLSWCTQGFVCTLWASPADLRFDFKCDLPLLLSCWGFSFSLGCGVSFFGGIQHSLVEDCSAPSCSFDVLTGEDKHVSFSSVIWVSPIAGIFFSFRGTRDSLFICESQCRQSQSQLTPLSWKCALKAYFSVISQVFR